MLFSKAIEGFIIHKSAEGKSPTTLQDYQRQLTLLCSFLHDPQTDAITTSDLRRFMAYLQTGYESHRVGRKPAPLGPKSRHNYWVALRSFFTWAMAELGISDPLASIKAPEYKLPIIEPLTSEEVKAILAACKRTRKAATHGRKAFSMRRPTALRDHALVLLLLDTGLRASECSRLCREDVDMATGAVTVKPFRSSRKSHPRHVYLGNSSRRALWRYLASREREDDHPALFVTVTCRPMSRNAIALLCRHLGEQAGIGKPVYPHRFRHTFAVTYLRNGGDVYTLQRLLGHASLDMVKRYLAIVQTDVQSAHRKASPVDNWNL